MPVFGAEGFGGDFPELPGELDAGGTGADEGADQAAAALDRICGGLGHLERAEDSPPDR